MDLLTRNELRDLMYKRDGMRVSIYMPTHRISAKLAGDTTLLENLLREAENDLTAAGMRAPEARRLLKPAHELVGDNPFWVNSSDGLAIFISDEDFLTYRLPLDFQQLVVVGTRYHVKPLVPLFAGEGHFYILALSQDEVRLLEGTRHTVQELEPKDMPASLAEALRFDRIQAHLRYYAGNLGGSGEGQAAGRSGGGGLMFTGHGVEDEDQKVRILRYFQQVSDSMNVLLADERAPLVLAGVEYLFPIYREASSYRYLLDEAIAGNPEELSAKRLHELAWPIVRQHLLQGQGSDMARYHQLAGTGLTATAIQDIVVGAYDGRVDTLFVPVGVQQWGTFDPATRQVEQHDERAPDDEDLLDLAAVETLLHDGTVHALEADRIPDPEGRAAIMRY